MLYDLVNYFDVWGNEVEGWEINDLCIEETGLYIDSSCTDSEIIDFLINIGYLKEEARKKVYVFSYDPEFIEIFQVKDDLPLYRLQAAR